MSTPARFVARLERSARTRWVCRADSGDPRTQSNGRCTGTGRPPAAIIQRVWRVDLGRVKRRQADQGATYKGLCRDRHDAGDRPSGCGGWTCATAGCLEHSELSPPICPIHVGVYGFGRRQVTLETAPLRYGPRGGLVGRVLGGRHGSCRPVRRSVDGRGARSGSPRRAGSRRPAPPARAAFDTKVCVPPDISDPATPMPLRPLTWAFTLGSARARSGRDHLGAQFVRWPL
jgi:hypothetical protein